MCDGAVKDLAKLEVEARAGARPERPRECRWVDGGRTGETAMLSGIPDLLLDD